MNLLNSTNFDTPYWGILGLVVALLWSFHFFGIFAPKNPLHLHGELNTYGPFQKAQRLLPFVLGLVIWSGIILTSMGPFHWKEKEYIPKIQKNVDTYFVLDVSLSMLANDYFPNRLEAAKNKIREIIDHLENTTMGLILFSEEVQTLSPLSEDKNYLKKKLSEVEVGPLGHGTNIGDALMLALARLGSEKKDKIVILLTDGVAQIGLTHPLKAAEEFQKQKVKIYSIGMGASEYARLPNNQLIPGGWADMKLLHEMAVMTKGMAFTGHSNEEILDALKKIGTKEKIYVDPLLPSDPQLRKKYYWMSPYFIYLVLALFFLEWFKRCYQRELL